MDSWLEFASGPLFRLSFTLMLLGLARVLFLSLAGISIALRRSGDRVVPWGDAFRKTVNWLFPVNRVWRTRPIYSTISVLFHVGLILVPLFYSAHILLFRESVGFAWPLVLPQAWAHNLTLLTLIGAGLLFLGRAFDKRARALSRRGDYLWPILLAVPFLTGYLCANVTLSAQGYQVSMLVHLLSANIVMLLIPFTKIAHCVLMPLSQYVSAVAWKFPKGTGDRVAATLGKKEVPV
ncbi:hypothetical protein KQI63_05575 [bacterium]|nr:hypothetical protein [bacterium]